MVKSAFTQFVKILFVVLDPISVLHFEMNKMFYGENSTFLQFGMFWLFYLLINKYIDYFQFHMCLYCTSINGITVCKEQKSTAREEIK